MEIRQKQIAMTLEMALALASSSERRENIRNFAESTLAGRQGVFAAVFRNPNEHGRFQHNAHDVSELAFSDSVVDSRPFTSVFGSCQRNDTRNDTRTEPLSKRLP